MNEPAGRHLDDAEAALISAARHLEAGQLSETTDAAAKALELMNGAAEQTARRFEKQVEARVLEAVASLEAARQNGSDAALTSAIERMEGLLAFLRRENRRLGPGLFSRLSRRARLRIAAAAAAGLILIIAGVLVRTLQRARWGLDAELFAGTNFEKSLESGRHHAIDFDWRSRQPFRDGPREEFSLRWRGFLRVPKGGDYRFLTRSDDGVRLWIGDALVIDDWNVHQAKKNEASITLSAGDVPIRLEYFQNRGRALIQLSWKKPGTRRFRILRDRDLLPPD